MADYYTQTSFAVHIESGEAEILAEIETVIDDLKAGFESPEEEMSTWSDRSERFRLLFPADDPTRPFASFLAIFDDETYPSHGADFTVVPDPANGGGCILEVSGDQVDPITIARLLQKVLPSALPFRFGWAETCSRLRLDDFGGGFLEVTPDRLIPLHGLGQDIDRQRLVVVVRDDECGLLFWNIETGFGTLKSATVFTQHEADHFRLPRVEAKEPGWLELPPYRVLLGDAA